MNEEAQIPEGIETVAVIGAGTIGASWTALFLAAGLKVDVYDPSETVEQYVGDYIKTAWPSLRALGLAKHPEPARPSFFATPEEAVQRAQFVQESVPERIEFKHETYRRIEPNLTPQALVASSASGLLVREMQQGWQDPSRFFLAHPFNPPHLIPLVELLVNDATADGVLERAEAFYAACGKVTIRVRKEVPGHIANRLQAAIWREAIHLVAEGVGSVEDVDKAISAGPGLRWAIMGPHMLCSLASGGHGLETFIERYGPSFERWWEDLGAPHLTAEVGATLAAGVREAEAGRDFAELAASRDAKVVAILNAMRAVDADSG